MYILEKLEISESLRWRLVDMGMASGKPNNIFM